MPSTYTADVARVSSAGIVIGVFAALVTQLLLNLLGLGLGLLAAPAAATGEAISWSSLLWWSVAGIIAAFVGGWVAGWMAGAVEGSPGFHGLATWAIATVVVIAGASMYAAAGSALFMGGPNFAPAREAATVAAEVAISEEAVGSMALTAFIALIIGAFAAFIAARMAAMREVRLHPHVGHGRAT